MKFIVCWLFDSKIQGAVFSQAFFLEVSWGKKIIFSHCGTQQLSRTVTPCQVRVCTGLRVEFWKLIVGIPKMWRLLAASSFAKHWEYPSTYHPMVSPRLSYFRQRPVLDKKRFPTFCFNLFSFTSLHSRHSMYLGRGPCPPFSTC